MLIMNSLIMLGISLPMIKRASTDTQKAQLSRALDSILAEFEMQRDLLAKTGLASLYLEDAKALTLNTISKKTESFLSPSMGMVVMDQSSKKVLRGFQISPEFQKQLAQLNPVSSPPQPKGIRYSWSNDQLTASVSFPPWNWTVRAVMSGDAIEAEANRLITNLAYGLGISLLISLFIAAGVIGKIKDIEQSKEILEAKVRQRTQELSKICLKLQ